MRKIFALATVVIFIAFGSSSLIAQKSNPLHNIPIEPTIFLVKGKISINDFYIDNDKIYVVSTITGFGYDFVSRTWSDVALNRVSEIASLQATCDKLTFVLATDIGEEQLLEEPGEISQANFQLGMLPIQITPRSNDNSLRNAFCSIAHLQSNNGSLNAVVAKLKQCVRAL